MARTRAGGVKDSDESKSKSNNLKKASRAHDDGKTTADDDGSPNRRNKRDKRAKISMETTATTVSEVRDISTRQADAAEASTLHQQSIPAISASTRCCWDEFATCHFPTGPTPVLCQKQGCDRRVHHVCHIQWRAENNHPEIQPWYCPWHDEFACKSTAMSTAASSLPAVTTTTTTNAPRHKNYCSWGDFVDCNLTASRPDFCEAEGCTERVHVLCQRLWEANNDVSEDSWDNSEDGPFCHKDRWCPDHHPNFKSNYEGFGNEMDDIVANDLEGQDELIENVINETIIGFGDENIQNVNTDNTNVNNDDDDFEVVNEDEDNGDNGDDDSSRGDYSDSDAEGEEMCEHNNYLTEVIEEQIEHRHDMSHVYRDDDEEFQLEEEYDDQPTLGLPRGGKSIEGAPRGWCPPFGAPKDWEYTPKYDAPPIDEIDNPGQWNLWSYAPKFNNKKKYIGHYTPAGATVVPSNAQGKRMMNGWEFHYDGWSQAIFDQSTYARKGATKADLKPKTRRGSLDQELLRKHGLNKERVNRDPLFFFQLLFPIADPSKTGVDNDNRIPYFSHVVQCTNGYSGFEGGGSDMGHKFQSVSEAEMVQWTAVPIRHGVFDGKPGTIYKRWDTADQRYDRVISSAMKKTRWTAIKRYFKLNNNSVEKERGEEGYDPSNKYDHIYKCLVSNINYFTLKADIDITIDESTWGFGGFTGECGGRLLNKPFSKGGQITMLFDINRRYPRVYEHRHSLHPSTGRTGITAKGPAELFRLIKKIDGMIIGSKEETTLTYVHPSGVKKRNKVFVQKKIFSSPPHICGDNFFASDALMDYAGEKGYGMTFTCRRDRYPDGLKNYVHHESGTAQNARARSMRFEMPIVAVKQVPARGSNKAYTKTLVSFQSTGATNILGVNNLPSVSLYVKGKERGSKNNKHVWGTEFNEARETYLNHYNAIDVADHMIKNAGCKYITWKYWHSPYLHALSLGLVVAYDMYKDCVEGYLDREWFVPAKERMNFHQFRDVLSEQMLRYNPQMKKYLGDESFRTYRKQTKKQRDSIGASNEKQSKNAKTKSMSFHERYALASSGKHPRCCNTSEDLRAHFESMFATKGRNIKPCEVCGEGTIWKCKLCNKSLCLLRKRGWAGGKCVMEYHNHEFFGLSRSDSIELYGRKSGWKPPDERAKRRNASAINRLRRNNNNGRMNNNNEFSATELEPEPETERDQEQENVLEQDEEDDGENSVHSNDGNDQN